MFTIDLLKGTGLPHRTSPARLAMEAVPFMVPVIVAVMLLFQYGYNNTVIATMRIDTGRLEGNIRELSEDMAAFERYNSCILKAGDRLGEVAQALGQHRQWSGILEELVRSLPEPVALQQLDLKRNASKKRVPDKNNPKELVTATIITRSLLISVFGKPSPRTDQAVYDYMSSISQSEALKPFVEDVRITSRQEEDIDKRRMAVYEIECLLKTQD